MKAKNEKGKTFATDKIQDAFELIREGIEPRRNCLQYEYREMKRAMEEVMFSGKVGLCGL